MRYFRLEDDLHVARRWHLGDITRSGASLKVAFDAHRPIDESPVDVEVTHPGQALDYTSTVFNVPIVTNKLGLALAVVADRDIQRLPACVGGRHGYEAINCIRACNCLDETRSGFDKWTIHDHRPDLAGQYRSVRNLTVDPSRIPADAHFFMIDGWLAYIVSDEVREAMQHAGCLGAKFTLVSP